MFLIPLLLLHLASLVHSLTLTSINDHPPWSQSYRSNWRLKDTSVVLYHGWPLQLNTSNLYRLEGAWHTTDRGYTWSPLNYTTLYQLTLACPDQAVPLHRKIVKIITSLDLRGSQFSLSELQWLAWQALITLPLNPEDRLTCLPEGRIEYALQPVSTSEYKWFRALRWHVHMPTPRFNSLTAVHYQNTHLKTDIYYVMGGAIPQPDDTDHYLHDLWASQDQGRNWIPIRHRYPWTVGTNLLSFSITSQGVMVVSVCNPKVYQDEIWVSMDGGREWDICRGETDLGLRTQGTLGFDAEGYLYVLGGRRTVEPEDNILRSEISFHNVSEVSRRCGHLDVNPKGPGLEKWIAEPGSKKTRPEMGQERRGIVGEEHQDL